MIVNVEARFDGGYNVLKVRKSVDNLPNLAIVYDGATQRTESVADDSMVIASRPGPPAPWWRISAGPTGYLAWESSDGMTWQALGSATATIPTQVSIDIGAGHTTNTSSGSARIASIALCN